MLALSKQKFFSTGTLIRVIIWLFTMMVAAILCSAYFFLNVLDDKAQALIDKRVEITLINESRHQQDIVEGFAYSDEAYQKLFIDNNDQWHALNTGDFLIKNKFFDFSLVVENRRQRFLTQSRDTISLDLEDLMQAGMAELMTAAWAEISLTKTHSSFMLLNDGVYLVAGSPFISEQTNKPRIGTFLAIGKRLDKDYLFELAQSYQIFDLSLSLKPNPQANKVLFSDAGEEIAWLSWNAVVPTRLVFPQVATVTVLCALISIIVTWLIISRASRDREAYEKKLYKAATRDGLTGVYNHRHFVEAASHEYHVSRYIGKPLCLLMMDIDHFKTINDTYGHQTGDDALKHFVLLCSHKLRNSDLLGRIGGEEFALLMPDTSPLTAIEFAESIRELIKTSPLVTKKAKITFTVSIGVSAMLIDNDFECMLEQADLAMYRAKRLGRDQVQICEKTIGL